MIEIKGTPVQSRRSPSARGSTSAVGAPAAPSSVVARRFRPTGAVPRTGGTVAMMVTLLATTAWAWGCSQDSSGPGDPVVGNDSLDHSAAGKTDEATAVVAATACFGDDHCAPGEHCEAGDLCLYYCAAGDPSCCYGNRCVPDEPEPIIDCDPGCGAGEECISYCYFYCSSDDPECCESVCVPATPTTECYADAQCGAGEHCEAGDLCYHSCAVGDPSCCVGNRCVADAPASGDCDPGCGDDEDCAVVCYHYCLPDDPGCCTSTCTPR